MPDRSRINNDLTTPYTNQRQQTNPYRTQRRERPRELTRGERTSKIEQRTVRIENNPLRIQQTSPNRINIARENKIDIFA